MKATTGHLVEWLLRLNLILRCFVIALLLHLAVLFLLATIKVGGILITNIPAIFTPPPLPPPPEEDNSLTHRFRNEDYVPPGESHRPRPHPPLRRPIYPLAPPPSSVPPAIPPPPSRAR